MLSQIEDQETRLHLITLGCVLDSTPNQDRWEALAALDGHQLADSSKVAYLKSQDVEQAFRRVRIRSLKHVARVWWQLCRGIQGRFKGSIRAMLEANSDDALKVLDYLNESKITFPVLSGPFTSSRWLDLVHRIGGVELNNWETLRVDLPNPLKEPAGKFDLDQNQVHPALDVALQVWTDSCENQKSGCCGLENCPGK